MLKKSILIPSLIFLMSSGCGDPALIKSPQIIKSKSGIEMMLIPAGSFEMGSRSGKTDEAPVHKITLSAFLMDRYEVTQEQYEKSNHPNPSHFKGPKNPVEQISWAQAALYCNARSQAEGLTGCYNEDTGVCNFEANGYRLPTEAEWEYACRAASTANYPSGGDARKLGDYAWFAENSGEKSHPVGLRRPNAFGLYDMHGNVAEWCNDMYDANYYATSPSENPRGPADGKKYVLRGGAWNSNADGLRFSARVAEDPGFSDACFHRDAIGFRCVRKP